MRVYWDQIRGRERRQEPVPAAPGRTWSLCRPTLRWRGFSAESTPRTEPYRYDYARVSRVSPVEADAGPLHARGGRAPAADGCRRHVRGRAARATRSRCRSTRARCRRCRAGSTRTFLFYADGFSKEMDLHSSSPDVVGAAALPRHDRLSVRCAGRIPARRRASRVPRRATTRGSSSCRMLPPPVRRAAMTQIRYAAAACQTDLPNPTDRERDAREHRPHARDDRSRRSRAARRSSRSGSSSFRSSRTRRRCIRRWRSWPNASPCRSRTSTPTGSSAGRARSTSTSRAGSFIETDPRWPGVVFNTTCLIGPEGILYKYRKVNPWIPYEVHASPHDIEGYDDPLFPVADTPIGRIGCAICYDWLFPEAIRQLAANGAEVLVRVSAYMDPVGRDRADELVDARQPLPRARERRRSSSPPIRGRACGITRRTRGRAAARSSTSTGGCSRRPRQDPASASSSGRST